MIRKPLSIASIAAEVAPFSKTGGLGEVARALPKALEELGHRVSIITPLHRGTRHAYPNLPLIGETEVTLGPGESRMAQFYKGDLEGTPVYFVDNPRLFSEYRAIYATEEENADNERFYFFDRAALALLEHLKHTPDVIQCHDWHTGLIPYFLHQTHERLAHAASVFTIHNLIFQMGTDWWTIPYEKQDDGAIPPEEQFALGETPYTNFALHGIRHADVISTVSERYAQEILTKKFGENLEHELKKRKKNLFGIVNGVDYETYNPKTDPGLAAQYDVGSLERKAENKTALQKLCRLPEKQDVAMIGMVSRITEQKGFDLVLEILDVLMRLKVQLVIMGSGDKRYERAFREARRTYQNQFSYLAFEPKYETMVYAGSDLFLMPSRFEPCGLGQLISLRYGSIPIVHAVGGLSDTISNYNPRTGYGNGFVFTKYDAKVLLATIVRGVENWLRDEKEWDDLLKDSMREVYSWKIPAQRYTSLFRRAMREHKKEGLAVSG